MTIQDKITKQYAARLHSIFCFDCFRFYQSLQSNHVPKMKEKQNDKKKHVQTHDVTGRHTHTQIERVAYKLIRQATHLSQSL